MFTQGVGYAVHLSVYVGGERAPDALSPIHCFLPDTKEIVNLKVFKNGAKAVRNIYEYFVFRISRLAQALSFNSTGSSTE